MNDDLTRRRTFTITAFAGLALVATAADASDSSTRPTANVDTDVAPGLPTVGQRMGGGGGVTARRIPNRRARITVSVQSVAGGLNNAIVRGVLTRRLADVRRCYEEGVAGDLGLHGHVNIRFVIGATGSVTGSEIVDESLHSDQVTTCITTAANAWTFPSPGAGTLVTAIAHYELSFR